MPGLEPWTCTAHSAAHTSCFPTPACTALAWVAGVAWTNAVTELSTQAVYPSPDVVLDDTLIALAFTAVASLMVIFSGGHWSTAALEDHRKVRSREAVEGYYTMCTHAPGAGTLG